MKIYKAVEDLKSFDSTFIYTYIHIYIIYAIYLVIETRYWIHIYTSTVHVVKIEALSLVAIIECSHTETFIHVFTRTLDMI